MEATMRRITVWLSATLTVIALVTSYQVSATGTGKAGEGEHGPHPGVACEHVSPPGENK